MTEFVTTKLNAMLTGTATAAGFTSQSHGYTCTGASFIFVPQNATWFFDKSQNAVANLSLGNA